MTDTIKVKLTQLLKNVGTQGNINFSIPPKADIGDLAFACFEEAKLRNQSAPLVAQQLVSAINDELKGQSPLSKKFPLSSSIKVLVEKCQAIGPYVNFYLNAGEIAKLIISEIQKQGKKYGMNKQGKNKKVLIEYPSNNTHKELHIGHLRNICIGNALIKIFAANGYKAIPINYVNDFGAHVARCLWGLKKFHNKEEPGEDKQKWLGDIYAEASQYLTEHQESKAEVEKFQKKLEARDKKLWPLFKQTRQWSLDGFKKVFKELKVKHHKVFYEKDVKPAGQRFVDKLLKKKIAQVGEGGAIIVDLKKYNLDIGLLRKSTGAGLYLTSDLGLAKAKNKALTKATEHVHITGSEQNFYFKQLFKILELAGYKYKMKHIGYGLVNRPEGKMSSRLGNVILYDEIRDEIFEQVFQETALRHPGWPKEKIIAMAQNIAFAAIKFDFLKHEAAKMIIFDAKSATSFDGFTGPYILYVVARISSILRKANSNSATIKTLKADYSLLVHPAEKQTVMLLGQFGEVVIKAFANYNPSVITKYSFDLAKQFNYFYNHCSVLKAENESLKKVRLTLSMAVKQALENCLDLLSIDTVEEM